MRGYFGIGIENCKTEENIGSLYRTAHAMGADFIFAIGRRYRRQSTDTTKAWKHIPFYQYGDFNEFYRAMPKDCILVGVEFPHEKAFSLNNYVHPERAIYLLGSEDSGLKRETLKKCHQIVYIPSQYCLNVAVAGSIIIYDRQKKVAKQ